MRDPRFNRDYRGNPEKPLTEKDLETLRTRATALAQAVPDVEMLREAIEWQREWTPAAAESFYSILVAEVNAKDDTHRAWVSALRTLINTDVHQHQAEPWCVRYRDEWQKTRNPFSAWDQQYSFESRPIPHVTHSDVLFFALYLLSQIDCHTWLDALDAFPFPNYATSALWFWNIVEHDRQLVEDLLRMAPVALSPSGEWLPQRRVVALILVEKIVSHAGLLYREVEQYERHQRPEMFPDHEGEGPNVPGAGNDALTRLTNDELPNWMRSAFRIVLDRPDGKAILIGYLAHLCDTPEMSREREAWEREAWDARACARSILAEELTRIGTTIDATRTVWIRSGAFDGGPHRMTLASASSARRLSAEEGEGARVSSGNSGGFLYAAALIADAGESSESELVALLSFLQDRLIARDQLLRAFNDSEYQYNAPDLFGRLLARLAAPDVMLREIYRKLEPQRRRALFVLLYEGDYDGERGSHFLLQVGLHSCVHAATQTKTKTNAHHELFWWLYEATRRLWLTSRQQLILKDEDRLAVARSFSFMPAIFGASLADAVHRAVAPIRNEAWLVSMAGAFLWSNGIEPAEVMRLFQNAGIPLRTALRDAHQWVTISEYRLEARHGFVRHGLPPIARDFAAALNIVFDTVSPVPERASLRNEFMSTVPWGQALWQTLESDGHTNIRVRCLESQTWLLQTTAPETLRQRFGLSPDIRVLAVHGQLASRDVRLAINEPADVGAVDPDLLVIACDHPDFAKRLASRIPGPFGQRIPWIPSPKKEFPPLVEMFRAYADKLDLFEYRDPVHGNGLIGRTHEIEELTTRLLRGEAVGVFGLRKVGKSSMMEAVAERMDPIGARRGMFRAYGVELPEHAEPEALVVSFDAQSVGAKSLSVLAERLLQFLDERLTLAGMQVDPRDIGSVDEDPLERFRRRLSLALERSPLPICFMIDEYDLLFVGYDGRGALPGIERFFAMLRAEANATRRVSLALVGRDPAFVDQPHIGGFTNPLLGWVYHQYLGPLRREEADELLVRMGKRVGLEVGQRSIDLGWQWTGGHPLLHRQYGSVLFELAHAPATRPRPAPTDPICVDAIEVFPSRDAVQTINGEIRTLLGVRFPASAELLEALAAAAPEDAAAIVARHGGKHSRAFRVLCQFGIVKLDDGSVWVPEIFRDEFGAYARAYARAYAQEVAGEE